MKAIGIPCLVAANLHCDRLESTTVRTRKKKGADFSAFSANSAVTITLTGSRLGGILQHLIFQPGHWFLPGVSKEGPA